MITTTLSSKNQITFPRFILDMLEIESGDKLLVETENNQIVVKPVGKSIIDLLVKSIKVSKDKKGISFKKVRLTTQKIVAKKLAAQ